jgi:hypothetical protein
MALAALAYIAAALTVAGNEAAANAAENAASENARRAEFQAGQERAASQRVAEERRKKARIMASRAIAVSAASGASGIEGILKGIAEEGETAAQYANYEGESRARGLTDKAAMGVYEAKQSAASKRMSSLQTIASTGVSMYSKYAGSGAPTSDSMFASQEAGFTPEELKRWGGSKSFGGAYSY